MEAWTWPSEIKKSDFGSSHLCYSHIKALCATRCLFSQTKLKCNSTTTCASRASAQHVDGIPYPGPLPVTTWISPTPRSRPQRPPSWDSSFHPIINYWLRIYCISYWRRTWQMLRLSLDHGAISQKNGSQPVYFFRFLDLNSNGFFHLTRANFEANSAKFCL